MKTRSRLSAKDADSAHTKTDKTTNRQDTDELLKVNFQISEVNKLRKPLNDLVLTIKKAQVAGSKKLTDGPKATLEQKSVIEKMRNDTLNLLKDLESHRMSLTSDTTPVTPFDFAGSKAVLDDLNARYLQVQSAIENGSNTAVALEQSETKSTGRKRSKAAKPQDGLDAPNDKNDRRQTPQGTEAVKGKGVDVVTDRLTKSKAPVAPQVKGKQRLVQNPGTKRGREIESAEPTESARKKIKRPTTQSDNNTLESDLSSIEESSNEEPNMNSILDPTHLHDETPNPPAAPPTQEKIDEKDVEMSDGVAYELPAQEPTAPPTLTILGTADLSASLSDVAGDEEVGEINKITAEATVLPNPGQADSAAGNGVANVATTESAAPATSFSSPERVDVDSPNVNVPVSAGGTKSSTFNRVTNVATIESSAPATSVSSPEHTDAGFPDVDILVSPAGNGVVNTATTQSATPATSISSPEHIDLNSLTNTTGNRVINKMTTEAVVAATSYANSEQMCADALAGTSPIVIKKQITSATTSGRADKGAKVAVTAAELIVSEKIVNDTTNAIGHGAVSSNANHARAEEEVKRRPKVINESISESSSDEDTTDDDEDDESILTGSSNYDSDEDDEDDGDDMRLADANDVKDLQQISNKKKGKKSAADKLTKSSPRETLRVKWDNMSAKEQDQWQNKAMKQICSFLRSPSTNPVKVNTRAMIREVAELCIPACNTTRQLALHILENRYRNKFCIFHQKTDKAGRIHDDSGHGPFRVTGTPFPRIINEKPKKMHPTQPLVECHAGFLHCGCSEDEALLEFYWWKMAEATSPATGHREGWLGHRKMDPRTRTMMFGFITEWTHMEVDDIFTGHPAKSDFDSRIDKFDTKIARLEAAKAKLVEAEEMKLARKAARKARREAKKLRKEQKKTSHKNRLEMV